MRKQIRPKSVLWIVLGALFIIIIVVGYLALTNASGLVLDVLLKRDFRYTLHNDTTKPIRVVGLWYEEYTDKMGYYVDRPWILESNQGVPNFFAECVYVVDEEGQELRSYDLNQSLGEWIVLEEGEQRLLRLSRNGMPCGKRLEDIEYCISPRSDLVPVEDCKEATRIING